MRPAPVIDPHPPSRHMALRLLTRSGDRSARKAIVAARFAGVQLEVPAFQMGVDNRTPEFLALSPCGRVPVLDTPDGAVFGAHAIVRCLAKLGRCGGALLGTSAIDSAHVDQWIDFASNELDAPLTAYRTEGGKEAVRRALVALDRHLATRTYLVGVAITLADVVVACSLLPVYTERFDDACRAAHSNVTRYLAGLSARPEFEAEPEPEPEPEPEEPRINNCFTHENVPSGGINAYTFALKPEEHQPSGTCSLSRIDNAVLHLKLDKLDKP
jgi:glutathione S-transferase